MKVVRCPLFIVKIPQAALPFRVTKTVLSIKCYFIKTQFITSISFVAVVSYTLNTVN